MIARRAFFGRVASAIAGTMLGLELESRRPTVVTVEAAVDPTAKALVVPGARLGLYQRHGDDWKLIAEHVGDPQNGVVTLVPPEEAVVLPDDEGANLLLVYQDEDGVRSTQLAIETGPNRLVKLEDGGTWLNLTYETPPGYLGERI